MESIKTKRVPKVENFQCKECSAFFKWRKQLNRHMRLHTGKNVFPCRYCGKWLLCKSDLVRHESTHTGEKAYPCSICPKSFRDKRVMEKHQQVHSREKHSRVFQSCSYCNKQFDKLVYLRRHEMTHMVQASEPPICLGLTDSPKPKPFLCPYCLNGFAQEKSVKRHILSHHRKEAQSLPMAIRRAEPKRNVASNSCILLILPTVSAEDAVSQTIKESQVEDKNRDLAYVGMPAIGIESQIKAKIPDLAYEGMSPIGKEYEIEAEIQDFPYEEMSPIGEDSQIEAQIPDLAYEGMSPLGISVSQTNLYDDGMVLLDSYLKSQIMEDAAMKRVIELQDL